jgi:hypothetical protein
MTKKQCTPLTPEQRKKFIREMKLSPRKTPRQCEHIKINGEFCGSPALRGRNYCYFHLTYHGSRLSAERQYARARTESADTAMVPLELPPLEDAAAIQMALMQVIDAILHNRIDNKRAGLVLYALQTASSNLARADFEQAGDAVVAGSYDAFEEDFELGDDAPELRADDPEVEPGEENADAELAAIAQACAQLEAAKQEVAKTKFQKSPDGTEFFECDPVSGLFCSISGPLSKALNRAPKAPRHEREAVSQRIRLASSHADDEADAEEEVA